LRRRRRRQFLIVWIRAPHKVMLAEPAMLPCV
jgi:hypothetical protein